MPAFYKRLLSFAHQYQLWSLSRSPQALLLLNYDMERYAALASSLHFAHTDLYGFPKELFKVDLDLDLQWDIAHEADDRRYDNWLGTVIGALEGQHSDYDLSDTHVSLERLCRYPLVFVPTVDFMDADDQLRLLAYVEQGGQLMIGPGVPYLDPALVPCEVLSKYVHEAGRTAIGAGSIWWVSQERRSCNGRDVGGSGEYWCEDTKVKLVLQTNEEHSLLFVANPTDLAREIALHFQGERSLRNVWGEPCVLLWRGCDQAWNWSHIACRSGRWCND